MSSIPATPKLVPVFSIKLQLQGAPQTLFTDSTKKTVSNMAIVSTGQISTIKNDLGYELDVENAAGYDSITAHVEKGYSELDAHIHGTTKDGDDVNLAYYGLFHSSPGLDAVLSGKATSHSFEESYLSNTPKIRVQGPCSREVAVGGKGKPHW
ncbi:hypothetical protein JCM33374_g2443 [Metschnikowia sp. JCM 33374]|nr:hypothetical protein JCM33374_g2443 [Metschnikowia sp. JCM 33374]